MYWTGQCVDGPHPCPHLAECDQHYIVKTGNWDYPNPLKRKKLPRKVKPKNRNRTRFAPVSKSKAADNHRRYLVKMGRASWIPVRTTLEEALQAAGL
jgi:hypothetical protein